MPRPGYGSKRRELAMLSKDAEAFSRALLEIWPDIKFSNLDAGEEVIERDGKIVDRRPKRNLRYYASLAEPGVSLFRVWREPEDWTLLWLGPNKYNVYELPNIPRFNFHYDASKIYSYRPHQLHSGRIWGYHLKDDKEHLRFLNKVWRLIPKLTDNVVENWDRDTGELRFPAHRLELWIGHHTAAWCRARPDRRIDESWRPGVEPSSGK
jgi:hypothetical protein